MRFRLSLLSCLFASFALANSAQSQTEHSEYEPEFSHTAHDCESDWLAPWRHNHFSQGGTPFVHSFHLEPAFLGRELFISYSNSKAIGEHESELEVELEWAFTKKIGMVLELPLVLLDPVGSGSVFGIGDFATAARALFLESENFLLAGNLEVSLPTGSEDKGLGSGELGLSPSISAWLDLGYDLQANTQFGTEHGLESGDSEFFYRASVIYLFASHDQHEIRVHDPGHSGAHSTLGVTSGILEFTGKTGLHGAADGHSTAELLFGISHNLSQSLEIRGGYQIPIGGNQEIDYSFTLGLVHHF